MRRTAHSNIYSTETTMTKKKKREKKKERAVSGNLCVFVREKRLMTTRSRTHVIAECVEFTAALFIVIYVPSTNRNTHATSPIATSPRPLMPGMLGCF